VSQRVPVPSESIDEGQVRLAVSVAGGGDGTAVAGEPIPGPHRRGDESWLMAAVSGQGGERTAVEVVNVLRSSVSDASTDDLGAVLKSAYRRLNSSFYQQGMGRQTASAVALVANGKYATIAHVGDGRAYLFRAGRLNQITREVAPAPLRTGKAKNDEAPPVTQPKPLLGARERLDSRQPAIYEITLLPDDRVLLCTATVYESAGEDEISQTIAGADSDAALAQLAGPGTAGAAVVAVISAARERPPIVITSEGQSSLVPLIATAVIILLLIAALAIYNFAF
jgi:protein phosphatase